jgi:hypothetical protein
MMLPWWDAGQTEQAMMSVEATTVPWLHVWQYADQMCAHLTEANMLLLWLEVQAHVAGAVKSRLDAFAAQQGISYPEAERLARDSLQVWERLRDHAYPLCADERAEAEAEAGRQRAELEAERMRAALERRGRLDAEREVREAQREVQERECEEFMVQVRAEGTAAVLADRAGRAIDGQWVKTRYAAKVPDAYAAAVLQSFSPGFQHEMYQALEKRVASLNDWAQEYKGCGDLVSDLSVLWRSAGGQSQVFWYAVCDKLYALPSDDGEDEAPDAEAGSGTPSATASRETRVIVTYLKAEAQGITFSTWLDLAAAAKDSQWSPASFRRHVLYPMYSAELDERKADGRPWFAIEEGQVVLHNAPEEAKTLMRMEGEAGEE